MNFRRLALYFAAAMMVFAGCSKVEPEPGPEPHDDNPPDTHMAGDFDYDSHKVVYEEEFRAAWIATVWNVDWPKQNGSANQKAELENVIAGLKATGFNAIVFQVVSLADAMYPSTILPWSAALTGTQGSNPGFDPLGVAVQKAHSLGMEVHAWFNPLRIGSTTAARASNHPYKSHPDWYEEYKDSWYWNPGLPAVRDFLCSIMKEVVDKYDVDGCHIDDYFYPSGLKSSALTWDDTAEFNQYGSGKTKDKWREGNINELIKGYFNTVHKSKPSAVFGVSPAGRLELTRNLYADPAQWVPAGTIDYLAPQIYWDHLRNDFADFDTVLPQWLAISGNVPVLPGLAAYKVSSSSEKTFYNNPAELGYQVGVCRGEPKVLGNIWYNTTALKTSTVANYVKANVYQEKVLTPRLGTTPAELTAPAVSNDGNRILWSESSSADDYVVLKLVRRSSTSKEWVAKIVYEGAARYYDGKSGEYYIVIARSGAARSSFSEVIAL